MASESESVIVSEEASRMSRLFDLRLLIGGLLSLYGVILIIAGIFDGHSQLAKADGLRINLWTGIGLLVVGLLFLLWLRLRPLEPLAPGTELDQGLATGAPPEDVS